MTAQESQTPNLGHLIEGDAVTVLVALTQIPLCFTQQNQGHTPKETRLTQLCNPTAVRIPKVRRFSNNPHMFGAHFDCVETK